MVFKATSVTNLTDARYFAAREVQYLGFNLQENTADYLDPMYMRAIREWVEGPVVVGELGDTALTYVAEAARFLSLNAVQVRRDSADGLELLAGLQVFFEIPDHVPEAKWAEILRAAAPHTAYFIIPVGEKFVPELAAVCKQYPVLLQTGVPAHLWLEIMETYQPEGFCLRGGEEEKVGVKSFDELEEIFAVLGFE